MIKPLEVKAVIFDRDGVIINSEYAVIESVTSAFKQFGFDVSKEDLEYIVGRSVNTYKDYFLKKWDFDFEKYREIQKQLFVEKIKSAKLFDPTIKLIDRLYSKGIPLGLTTSAGKDTTEEVLKRAGIESKFKVIVTKEDCTKLKPYPEPYITTARRLNIEPQFCVVIEDTELGVEAAKNAGTKCIAIPNEFTKNHDFSKADFVVESGDQVDAILSFVN